MILFALLFGKLKNVIKNEKFEAFRITCQIQTHIAVILLVFLPSQELEAKGEQL